MKAIIAAVKFIWVVVLVLATGPFLFAASIFWPSEKLDQLQDGYRKLMDKICHAQ